MRDAEQKRKYNREYYHRNKDKIRTRQNIRSRESTNVRRNLRRANKEIVVREHGGKCLKCGYDRYIGALTFHHRDPTTKKFNVCHAPSLKKMREEAEKCDLLCFNCHEEIEHEEEFVS